ncbi:hypothetical protein G6F68_010399 [Rhizopus microsporus]|nr:hypothetical protein G6F68_010399 [Rhizopus microsporus]
MRACFNAPSSTHVPICTMIPSRSAQRLHAHHVAVAGADQRLVAQLQFAVGNRIDNLPRDDALAVRAGRSIHRVDAHRVAAFARGLVQRVFGVVKQARSAAGMFGAQAHAQLAGHEQRVRQHRQRQLHLLPDLLGEVFRQRHVGGARYRDQEFVAAVAPQLATPAQVGLQALRHQHQGLVAHFRAHVLVHRGEVVDVHMHQHQRGTARSRVGDHRLQLGIAGAKAVGCIVDADRGQVGIPHRLSIPVTQRWPCRPPGRGGGRRRGCLRHARTRSVHGHRHSARARASRSGQARAVHPGRNLRRHRGSADAARVARRHAAAAAPGWRAHGAARWSGSPARCGSRPVRCCCPGDAAAARSRPAVQPARTGTARVPASSARPPAPVRPAAAGAAGWRYRAAWPRWCRPG